MRALRCAFAIATRKQWQNLRVAHQQKNCISKKNTKKKKRNNDNGKQTTNKPTTNRNVQQFILNRRRRCRRWIESKNHNKRTRLCVWRSTRNVVFIFLWSVEKAKILRNTRQNGNGTHGVWISRAVKRNCRNETYDDIVAARLIGSLNQPVLLPASRAENTHDPHVHTHTHAHRDTVKRAHIHSEVAGSTRRDTLPAANTETDCICRCFG